MAAARPNLSEEAQLLAPTPSSSFEQIGSEGQWHVGFCCKPLGCGGDIGICCTGLWCPCILFGRNVELLAEEGIGSGSARTSCFNFWSIPAAFSLTSLGLLAALGGFTAHPAASQLVLRSIQHGCYAAGATALASYASRRRSQLRQLEGLPEGPLSDWWSYFWCPGLTVCQEAAQLKHCQRRRLDAEAGGHRRTTVQPPPLQRMA